MSCLPALVVSLLFIDFILTPSSYRVIPFVFPVSIEEVLFTSRVDALPNQEMHRGTFHSRKAFC